MTINENFANQFQTFLASAIGTSDSSITVSPPPPVGLLAPFRIKIGSEYCIVTAMSGTNNVTWAITRAQEGSSLASHAVNSVVVQVFTAGSAAAMVAAINAAGTAGSQFYTSCKYAFTNPTTVDPTSFTWADVTGAGSAADIPAGTRLFKNGGTAPGIYVCTSATAATLSTTENHAVGKELNVTYPVPGNRYICISVSPLTFAPLDDYIWFGPPSGGDDWPAFRALCDTLLAAGSKRGIKFVATDSYYQCNSEHYGNLPNKIDGNGQLLVSSLSGSPAAPFPAIFGSQFTPASTALTVGVSYSGSFSIVSNTTIPKGTYIALVSPDDLADRYTFQTVKAPVSAGGGNFTIALDHKLPVDFVTGCTINIYTDVPHDFEICNFIFSGTASRIFSYADAMNCSIHHCQLSNAYGLPQWFGSWDNGGYKNQTHHISLVPGTDPVSCGACGLSFETNTDSSIYAIDLPDSGLWLDACHDCNVGAPGDGAVHVNVVYIACTQGAEVAGMKVTNCFGAFQADSGTLRNIDISNNTWRTYGPGTSACYLFGATTDGLHIHDNRFLLGGTLDGSSKNLANGINLGNSSHSNITIEKNTFKRLTGISTPANGNQMACGIQNVGGGGTVTGLIRDNTYTDVAAYSLYAGSSIDVDFKHEIATTAGIGGNGWVLCEIGTSGRYRFTNCNYNAGAAYCWEVDNNIDATLDSCQLAGSHKGILYGSGTVSIRLKGDTVITGGIDSSVQLSRGTATISSGSIAVPFATLKAGESPAVSQKNGTPTAFIVASTAGTGFTITGAAGDYNYALP